MEKEIYLDHAGATPLDPQVKRTIFNCLDKFGNASSVHLAGRQAKDLIDDSRKKIAQIIGSKADQIIFTSSGTESNNLAIFGAARAYKKHGNHIITSKIEHPAIIESCKYLEKHESFEITYLDVKKNGIIDPSTVARAIRPDTILISIMYANNEIGTIQPIKEISRFIRNLQPKTYNSRLVTTNRGSSTEASGLKPIFHTDACQAAGALDLNIQKLGVDLLTLNGAKIYGPKGIGCLYIRRGVKLSPVIFGGSQEKGLRAGTENPALIAGLAKSLELADKKRIKESIRLAKLRDYLISKILKIIPGTRLNGDLKLRLPNNVNFSFKGISGEMLMLALDQKGVRVATGSACSSGSTDPSLILKAIGLPDNLARGNIRLTLGRETKKKELDKVIKLLPALVRQLS